MSDRALLTRPVLPVTPLPQGGAPALPALFAPSLAAGKRPVSSSLSRCSVGASAALPFKEVVKWLLRSSL